ncbi:hypothetical protein Ancab_037263 [Ancistrocladus abbreviatus]
MDDRIEDAERQALAAIEHAPLRNPSRRSHSKSQQLCLVVSPSSKRNQVRKHSLYDGHIPKIVDQFHDPSCNGASEISHRYEHPPPIGGGDGDDTSERIQPLTEFVASGSATGIFKAPMRAAVHPNRPVALELRPHPLKETQSGKFLRTIGCTDSQLWAGQESGVRFWNFGDAYEMGTGLGARVRRGDEEAAPFYESGNTAPTTCMMVDKGTGLVWTGHKDGRIRSWKMGQTCLDESGVATPIKEGLSWQAHRGGPVLSMVMSSYGDLWAGFEGGVIKVWPWEAIEKSLSLSSGEKHMAAVLVERAMIDLKNQVIVNGVCNISSSDVKAMLSDYIRGRVWCAGAVSFSLWDARTKELVKVFNIDGQIENRAEMPTGQDRTVENDVKVKFSSTSKKEKSGGFLQRSRNAIMGAADAVRRVATRGAAAAVVFNEDTKKTEALEITADGTIWSGCSSGLLVQWDGNGNRLQDFNHHPFAVLCFCTHGSRVWVGYASGLIQLLDLDGNLIAGWVAHGSPVVKLAIGAGYVFSLATHGGVRGWNLASPGPLDKILRAELAAKEMLYTRRDSFKMLIGTWNVSQGKPPTESLKAWLGSAVLDVGILVVGLQEVEMGAGFLAMSAAKETVGLEGSAIGQMWQDAIGKTIQEGSTFERVGSRQLAALLVAIWQVVRKSIRTHVGDLEVGAVACGFGRAIGNKGGVGLRLRVHDRIICFVNCHLAAHLEAVNRRNADFDHIFRMMVFTRHSNLLNVAAASSPSSSQVLRPANGASANPEVERPELSDADMVIFFGDFNYRLFGITYDEARDLVSQRSFEWLRKKDQLRAEMKAGKVFHGMREAIIRFPPTYKFARNVPGLGGYDSGEKKRIPAWCDRIIYRDNRDNTLEESVSDCSLNCPIVSSILQYEACMEVTESDHKPVRCKLHVRMAHVDRSVRRKVFGEILKGNDEVRTLLQELSRVPETTVSTDNIMLQNQGSSSFEITNGSGENMATFHILCEGQSTINDDGEASHPRIRGSFGFPAWIEITPAAGIIRPEQVVEVCVRHKESHNSGDLVDRVVSKSRRSEDTSDKEVILAVNVQGSCSTDRKIHRVCVRYCHSTVNPIRVDSLTNSCSPTTAPLQRSEALHQLNIPNMDGVDHG